MEQIHCEQASLAPAKRWLLLVVLSYTSFIFNTTEFIPIGLLSDIAKAFRTSETTASLDFRLCMVCSFDVAASDARFWERRFPQDVACGFRVFRCQPSVFCRSIQFYDVAHLTFGSRLFSCNLLVYYIPFSCPYCTRREKADSHGDDYHRDILGYDYRHAVRPGHRTSFRMEVFICSYRPYLFAFPCVAGRDVSLGSQQARLLFTKPSGFVQAAGCHGSLCIHHFGRYCPLYGLQLYRAFFEASCRNDGKHDNICFGHIRTFRNHCQRFVLKILWKASKVFLFLIPIGLASISVESNSKCKITQRN